MKKILSLFIGLFILINIVSAQTITVSGAGKEDINGVYTFDSWQGYMPNFVKDDYSITFGIYGCCSPVWAIVDSNNNLFYENTSHCQLPPSNEWIVTTSTEGLSVPVLSQVSNYIEFPDLNLQVSNNVFENKTVLIILHSVENVTFTGLEEEDFVQNQKISFQNLPNYIDADIVKLNDTVLYLTLKYITKNDFPTSSQEFNLVFQDAAFSNNSQATILQNEINTFTVDFLNEITDIKKDINIFYKSGYLNITGIENFGKSDFIEIYSLDGKLVYNNLLKNNYELNLMDNQIYVVKIQYNNQIIIKKLFNN